MSALLLRTLMWLAAAVVLSACAQQPVTQQSAEASPPAAQLAQTEKPDPSPDATAELPPQELTPQILIEFLLAELAIQRQEFALAAQAYAGLARKTRDPRIARRATEVAIHARDFTLAVEAATIWLQADPKSVRARQTLASILVSTGSLEDIRPHLEMWLTADPQRLAQAFQQINNLLARHADKAGVAELVRELAQKYPKLPEAHAAAAQAGWAANQPDEALASVRAALALRPDWEQAALFQAQVLQRRSSAEALAYYRQFLEANPQAKDVRLNYARLLAADGKTPEARAQFERLARDFPDNGDVALAVGLLAVQMSDFDAAETHLKRVLDLNAQNADTVRFYLGQINEERKRPDEAVRWYRSVTGGEQYIPAQTRIAGMLAKGGQLNEARALLQGIQPQSIQQRVQLAQAEAHMLRDASAYKDAFEVLAQAVEKLPNVPDLLYDFAMAAEKVDRLDLVESNLRKLIELRPDHAHAYNALGYTLADRNQRLDEAYALIEKALSLAPDDPFIQDSMGWVLYRMGRLEEGQAYLERAYKARPDPEIAAHLGEVLWEAGRREEAERIWTEALKAHPNHEVLQGTIKKYLP